MEVKICHRFVHTILYVWHRGRQGKTGAIRPPRFLVVGKLLEIYRPEVPNLEPKSQFEKSLWAKVKF